MVQNSIFWNNVEVFEGITDQIDLTVDHCLMPAAWQNLGVGNISADPLFAKGGYWDPNGTPDSAKDDFWVEGDYHLKSKAGRWDPALGQWVMDTVTSPCIDAGNDRPDWINELWPNGGRINLGAYGGTRRGEHVARRPQRRDRIGSRDHSILESLTAWASGDSPVSPLHGFPVILRHGWTRIYTDS